MNYSTQKTYSLKEAQAKLESYCEYQERCHKEVNQKLLDMKMIPEAIEVIKLHLLKHNFLNETRFAQAFTRGKFNQKKLGKLRIKRELSYRDISKYNIELGLKEICEEKYLNTFNDLAQKRFEQFSSESNPQKKIRKIADYLLYRGLESFLVYDKIRTLV